MLRQSLKKLRAERLAEYNRICKDLFYKLSERYRKRTNKSFRQEVSRKLIHLSSLWIPAFIYFVPQNISITFFAFILSGDALLEYGNYKRWRWARRTFGVLFYRTLRSKELVHDHFEATGSLYVLSAAILCPLMFSQTIATIALTIMLTSDTCAALFGKAFGTRKLYKKKSLEGTSAFFLCTLLVLMLYTPIYPVTYASIIAAFLATLCEMFEDKLEIDDNLSVPLVIGIILTLLS